MSESYIPTQDTLALAWMEVFAAGITASPGTYNLAPADAAAITLAVNNFSAALDVCLDPATKTKVAVAQKDDMRVSAEQICRQYAVLIKYNAGISDPDKIAIGVPPVNTDRNPIPAPETSPVVNIIAATQGAQTIRYADTLTPGSPAKPFGVANLQLYVAVAEEPVVNPGLATFRGQFTRNPIGVMFSPGDNGKQATYFARWVSPRGEVGPWSFPVSMAIAA